MARLKKEQKEEIVAKWKAGVTQNWLSKEYNTSPATINKYCKGVEQDNVEIVNTKISLHTAMDGKSEQEVNAIHHVADEKIRHLQLFQNSALKNQVKANKMLETTKQIHEVEAHSRITQRNKETVLGKDKTTEINQTQQTEVKSISVTYE